MDYQELFNHLYDEHDLILLESEMQEIINIVNKMQDNEEFSKETKIKTIEDISDLKGE